MIAPSKQVHKVTITNRTFKPAVTFSFYGALPDEITESHTANFYNFDIISRSGQLFSYGGGNSREIQINIDVHEDYLAEFVGKKADIRQYAAQFKTLTYPEYTDALVVPPSLILKVGTFIRFHGICTSSSVTWHRPMRNGRYIYCTFSLSLLETNSLSFAASEIYSLGDLRRF